MNKGLCTQYIRFQNKNSFIINSSASSHTGLIFITVHFMI